MRTSLVRGEHQPGCVRVDRSGDHWATMERNKRDLRCCYHIADCYERSCFSSSFRFMSTPFHFCLRLCLVPHLLQQISSGLANDGLVPALPHQNIIGQGMRTIN